MAEEFGFFDPIEIAPGEWDREYNADQFTNYLGDLVTTGVMKGAGAELRVSANGSNMITEIDTGVAFVEGKRYANTAKLAHTHDTETIGRDRIDRIVVRKDLNQRWVKSFIKKGVASTAPVPPALTQTANVYEISLAQVKVIGGQTFISTANVVDERGKEIICPWAGSKILPNFDDSNLENIVSKVNGFYELVQSNSGQNKHLVNNTNMDDIIDSGFYRAAFTTETSYGLPAGTYAVVVLRNNSTNGVFQFFTRENLDPGAMYTRVKDAGNTWHPIKSFVISKLPPPIPLVLKAGWLSNINYGSILSYYKDSFGVVHLKGNISLNSGSNTVLGTLPMGYRPTKHGAGSSGIKYNIPSPGGNREMWLWNHGDIEFLNAVVGERLTIDVSFRAD